MPDFPTWTQVIGHFILVVDFCSYGHGASHQMACLFCNIYFVEPHEFFWCESWFVPLPANHHLMNCLTMAFRLPVSHLGLCWDLQKCNMSCEHFFPVRDVNMEATTIPANTICLFCECSATAHLQVVSFLVSYFYHANCHAFHFLEECPTWSTICGFWIGYCIIKTWNNSKAAINFFLSKCWQQLLV